MGRITLYRVGVRVSRDIGGGTVAVGTVTRLFVGGVSGYQWVAVQWDGGTGEQTIRTDRLSREATS